MASSARQRTSRKVTHRGITAAEWDVWSDTTGQGTPNESDWSVAGQTSQCSEASEKVSVTVIYNRTLMRTGTHRGLPLRPLVVILLGVCLAATDSSRTSAQQSEQQQPFPRSAWAAIAHGRLTEAESLARARAAEDPEAAAVIGHLAARSGK